MLKWEKLKYFHKKSPDFRILRNDNIQKHYEKFLKNLNDNNININDYIYKNFLGTLDYNLTNNTFPYYIEEDCNHYILWFNNEYFKKVTYNVDEDKIINNIIRSKFKDNEYIYFENNDNNKSVSKVKHFHVFIKN